MSFCFRTKFTVDDNGLFAHRKLGLTFQRCVNLVIQRNGHAKTRKLYYRKDYRAMRRKSKQTTNSHTSTSDHVILGWLNSTGRYGRRCWTNIYSQKFIHVPLGLGGWPLGYEERRCWANCSCS